MGVVYFVVGLVLSSIINLGGGQLLGGGTGTIDQLPQFVSTSSPSSAITQAVYGKALRLTGLESLGCLGTNANGVVGAGTCSGGAGTSAYEIATTSNVAVPELAYFTKTGGRTTLGSVATGTISVPTGLTITANRSAVGGSAAIALDTGYVIPLQTTLDAKALGATTITVAGTANQITSSAGAQDLSANRTWTLSMPQRLIFPKSFESTYGTTTYASSTAESTGSFQSTNATTTGLYITGLLTGGLAVDGSGQVYKAATTTAGTGLTYSGNAFNVNTSQNIATLSNLTTNGLVTTSGSNGTLGVTANTTNGLILAMSGGVPTWVATTTFSTGLSYSNGVVTNSGVTSLGVPGGVLTGALVIATSSTAYNGLTASTTVTCVTLTCTFANTLAGILGVQGGGTGAATLTGLISGNGTSAFTATANGTAGFVLAMSGGIPTWVATTTLSTITGTLSVLKGGTGLTTFGGTNTILFTTAADTLSSDSTFVYNSAGDQMGIGTTTPRWPLTVSSSTAPQLTLTDASATQTPFNFRSLAGSLYISTSSATTFATTTRAALSITGSNGFVGIATSTPTKGVLSIEADANTTGLYLTGSQASFLEANVQNLSSSAGASSDYVATADTGTPTTNYVDFGINGSGGGAAPFATALEGYMYSIGSSLNLGALGATSVMTFNTTGGTSPVERARFTADGDFGIGTTSPKWRLTVASSTGPQVTLTDASLTNAPFNFRVTSNAMFISTSSPTTFATSTLAIANFDSQTASTTVRKLDKTDTATSTFAGGIYLTGGCFSINGTCVGGSGTPGGSATELQYRNAGSFGAITNSAYTTAGVGNGYVGFGTTTPRWTLQLASSTQPQLALSDTTITNDHWTLRARNNSFYLATSSPSTFATSTIAAMSIDPNGTMTLSRPLGVASGGTGAITFTTNGVLYGNTASAIQVTAQGAANSILTANAGAPSFSAAPTIGTSVTTPILYGGAAAGSTLTIRSTSGVGVGADAIIFGLGSNGANEVGRMTGRSYFGLGTTTPKWLLQVASSTRAQLTLSDGSATNNHFSFRAINNWFYLSSSTPTTFASTTNPILSIAPGGQVSTYAVQPATSTAITLDWEQTPNQVEYQMGTAAYTITMINATTSRQWGSTKRVYLCNPAAGTPGVPTWSGAGLHFFGGTNPTQSTAVNVCDLYSFNVTRATSTATYFIEGAQTTGAQ